MLAASAKALQLCNKDYSVLYSYIDLQRINKGAAPIHMLKYKHVILLFKPYNSIETSTEWVKLNFQRTLTGRQSNFIIYTKQ
jgi:hypothetical protein